MIRANTRFKDIPKIRNIKAIMNKKKQRTIQIITSGAQLNSIHCSTFRVQSDSLWIHVSETKKNEFLSRVKRGVA